MNNIQAHLKKIRSDAAECLVLGSLASDGKQEMFIRIAEHLNALALELETSTKIGTDRGDGPKDDDNAVFNLPPQRPQQPAAWPRRVLPWMLVIVLGGTSGTLIWANSPAQKYRSFMQAKPEAAPQDNSSQTELTLRLSGEQAERELLLERMTALAGRLDGIESSLDSLKKASAETTAAISAGSAGAETKSPASESGPPPSVEKPAESSTSKSENPTSLKQADAVGPPGCSQFRSFDPKSGTYVTLDGRRRQCR
ncbi:MAG: BA14K family protein [Bradyrhizobium sp.]